MHNSHKIRAFRQQMAGPLPYPGPGARRAARRRRARRPPAVGSGFAGTPCGRPVSSAGPPKARPPDNTAPEQKTSRARTAPGGRNSVLRAARSRPSGRRQAAFHLVGVIRRPPRRSDSLGPAFWGRRQRYGPSAYRHFPSPWRQSPRQARGSAAGIPWHYHGPAPDGHRRN